MSIISLEIIKILDKRELQKTTKEKQNKTERSKGNRSYSEAIDKGRWIASHWRGIATCLYSQLAKLLLILHNMNYPRNNLIYLKQVYTFRTNQTKCENPKSSLPLKRFSIYFFTTWNPRKPKVKWKRISCILQILVFTTTNLVHVYYVNIASYKTLRGIKILL